MQRVYTRWQTREKHTRGEHVSMTKLRVPLTGTGAMILFSLNFALRCKSYFGLVPMVTQPVIRGSNQSGVIVKIALRNAHGMKLGWRKSSLEKAHSLWICSLTSSSLDCLHNQSSNLFLYLIPSRWEKRQGEGMFYFSWLRDTEHGWLKKALGSNSYWTTMNAQVA